MSDHRDSILARLDAIENLPSFPNIVVKLSSILEDEDTQLEDIEEVIRMDMSISSSLIRLANTVAFNHGGEVTSLYDAIMRIGFRNVKDIIMSISVIQSFGKKGMVNYQKFWEHSLAVAFAAQVIEQYAGNVNSAEETYITGLLHDIGILVLDQYFSDLYTDVLEKAKLQEEPLKDIEQYEIGLEQAEVGARLLERWELKGNMIEAVRFQNKPYCVTDPENKLAKVIHLANFACENQGLGNGIESFPEGFSNSAWFEIGMHVDDIDDIIGQVRGNLEKAKAIFQAASAA